MVITPANIWKTHFISGEKTEDSVFSVFSVLIFRIFRISGGGVLTIDVATCIALFKYFIGLFSWKGVNF